MANFNKVILIGRLTRDPEVRTFASGGKVAKFGFAVTNRRKNTQTGQWEDEPMFIDVEVYNRGEFGRSADLVEERLRKGSQICLEGRLHLDTWDDKQTGQKRSKHKIVADNFQFLDPRTDGEPGAARPTARAASPAAGRSNGAYEGGYDSGDADEPMEHSGGDDDIPF
ncbi:MAG TPA: single-stranded DNA-binding protein [Gemmataceae bacterium]